MHRFIATALAACASSASAQVVYEHFQPVTTIESFVAVGYDFGEYVTLAGGAAYIGSVDFQFGTFFTGGGTEGTLSLSFCNDAGGFPGAPFSTFSSQPITLVGEGPMVVTLDTGGVTVPQSVWVTVRFVKTGGSDGGIVVDEGTFTVGSASSTRAFRADPANAWSLAGVGSWMEMRINASQACYANCDASTAPPILNANDFQCFLNKFAAQDSAANCDASTAPPILNANDFQCFLNKYAAGCT